MRTKQVLLAGLYLAVIFSVGCQETSHDTGQVHEAFYDAGQVSVAFFRATLLSDIQGKDVDTVYAAAKKALNNLNLAIITEKNDKFTALITARTAEDKKVTVELKAQRNNATQVAIQFGVLGDRDKSQVLLNEINKVLTEQ